MKISFFRLACLAFSWLPLLAHCRAAEAADQGNETTDGVVIYKASPAGIVAAVAASEAGTPVVLLEPTAYVGGIIAQGGLCVSDVGNSHTVQEAIGGWSREFFRRVAAHYRDTYGEGSAAYRACVWGELPGAAMEPKVAEMVFENLLKEHPAIQVIRKAELTGVEKEGNRIRSVTCLVDGKSRTFAGGVFIDASYTGDLMALAGVPYRLGSEAKDEFGESLARGKAGPQIQAYNYRVTLTNREDNRVPVAKPETYDPENYREAIRERLLKDPPPRLAKIFPYYWRLPNNKQDANIADRAGKNWDYPEAEARRRAEIEAEHRENSLGFLYFLQNDPSVPEEVRSEARKWGLPKDEFADNGHFPRELYIREARRLDGEYVMRQSDLQENRGKPDTIGLGNYFIDCHATEVYRNAAGKPEHGGMLFEAINPYEIAYRSLVPREKDCENLLVPVCLSATHIAWTSLRMEPVFMITGEAAGRAAALALSRRISVQQVPVEELQRALRENKGFLNVPTEPAVDFTWEPANPQPGEEVRFQIKTLPGASQPAAWFWNFDGGPAVESNEEAPMRKFSIEKNTLVTLVVRDAAGKQSLPVSYLVPVGRAMDGDVQRDSEEKEGIRHEKVEQSTAQRPYFGKFFFHDSNLRKGQSFVEYSFPELRAGTHAVWLSAPKGNWAKAVQVKIETSAGEQTVQVNQQTGDEIFGLVFIGDFALDGKKPLRITILNDGSNGYVIYDAVRCILQSNP